MANIKRGTLVRVNGNRYVWAVVAKVGTDYVLGRKHGERVISGSYPIDSVTPCGKPVGTKAQEKESRRIHKDGPVRILNRENALDNFAYMRDHAPTESARRVWIRRIERLSK